MSYYRNKKEAAARENILFYNITKMLVTSSKNDFIMLFIKLYYNQYFELHQKQ